MGRSFWTFEGSFINEECEPDGAVNVNGKRWLSMIFFQNGIGGERPFQWDEHALRTKLEQIQ